MDTILITMIELKKKYKSGSAIEILQEAILIGDIPEGITLTQNELAESLGTSRMPVREALIVLEYQGLIERQTNQHINTVAILESDIKSVFQDMAYIEIEIIRNYPPEHMQTLSLITDQKQFHRLICIGAFSPFRYKILKTMTEIYLAFVLDHSEDTSKIDSVFANLRETLIKPGNFEVTRAAYAVYSEVLAGELMRIRIRRKMKECSISDR